MLNRRDFMSGAAPGFAAMTVTGMTPDIANAAEPVADVRADIAKFTDIKPTIMLGKSL
jgi:hypothetical protein